MELNKKEYRKVIPMIQGADINTMFAVAVLEEKVEGKVYVDEEESPTNLYIQHSCGMSLLYGEKMNKEFLRMLESHMLNKKNIRDKFEWLQVYPASLYQVVDEILGDNLIKMEPDAYNCSPKEDKKVLEYQRINFCFKQDKYDLLKNKINNNYFISNGYKIISTTEAIFNQLKDRVVPKLYWNSYKDFTQNGIGYTLLSESNVPVATAFSAFTSENKLEIGIETNDKYRGLGFATLVCSKLIDYCIEKGIEPVWSCNSANLGSRKLANKLGFEEVRRIPYYRLDK